MGSAMARLIVGGLMAANVGCSFIDSWRAQSMAAMVTVGLIKNGATSAAAAARIRTEVPSPFNELPPAPDAEAISEDRCLVSILSTAAYQACRLRNMRLSKTLRNASMVPPLSRANVSPLSQYNGSAPMARHLLYQRQLAEIVASKFSTACQ